MGERVLRRQHRRQHFVIDAHQLQGFFRRPLVERGDAGDFVADEADVIGGQRLLVLRPRDHAVLHRQLVADERGDDAGVRQRG